MATLTLTRIAHSSVLLDFDGHTILTDPWFSERFGYYHGEPYGVALADLPHLDGVLGSHGHYDHFDMQAFKAYPDKSVTMLVKTGMASAARRVGFTNITEMEPWQTAQLGPVKVTAAPAKHGVPENTYVLEYSGLVVYFGADTMLIPALNEVAARFPHIDLALLAVNGLCIRPQLNRQVVMDARQAAQLCATLNPRYAVPIHYAYTGGPLFDHLLLKYTGTAAEFARAAAEQAPQTAARILAPGEPLRIEAAVPARSAHP